MKEAVYAEILRMIKEEEPPRPSTRLSDSGEALASISANRHTEPAKLTKLVRGELDWIVMKCLEKDRARRYETANGFAADVQRYLADEPVAARPTSAAYRAEKFVHKHRAAIGAAAALAASLVLGVVGTTWMMVRATNERDRAVTFSGELDQQRLEALGAQARAERERAAAVDSEAQARHHLVLMHTSYGFVGDMVAADDPNRRDPNLTVRQMPD